MGQRPPKAAELIAANVRRRIVIGEFEQDEPLPPEHQLQDAFGVSRPTLREAFRILEAERLIEIRRGSRGGARVLPPTLGVAGRYVGLLLQMEQTTIGDVYEARMLIEPAAAGMLAKRRTTADVTDLRACADTIQSRIETTRDVNEWMQVTYEFHDLVLERAGNHTLKVQAGVLREIVAGHLARVARVVRPGAERRREFRRAIASYRRLADLVEGGNVSGARQHWHRHMDVARQSVLRDELGSVAVLDLFR
jgi:GntR family transcriptional repressor for pyruvate dehydrogenase complex